MQNNIKRTFFQKVKSTYLGSEIETDIFQIKKFFTLIILMGIIYKQNILKHWSTDVLYSNFSKVMARDTFHLLQEPITAVIPIMGEEAAATKFVLLLIRNFVINFTILKIVECWQITCII